MQHILILAALFAVLGVSSTSPLAASDVVGVPPIKRGLKVVNLGFGPVSNPPSSKREEYNALFKRDKVLKCGSRSQWMPMKTVGERAGFVDTYKAFCYEVEGKKVPYSEDATHGLRIQLDGITLKNSRAGHFVGEVVNSVILTGYTIVAVDCMNYMALIANSASSCYGSTNDDCKGGSYGVTNIGKFNAYPWPN